MQLTCWTRTFFFDLDEFLLITIEIDETQQNWIIFNGFLTLTHACIRLTNFEVQKNPKKHLTKSQMNVTSDILELTYETYILPIVKTEQQNYHIRLLYQAVIF